MEVGVQAAAALIGSRAEEAPPRGGNPGEGILGRGSFLCRQPGTHVFSE